MTDDTNGRSPAGELGVPGRIVVSLIVLAGLFVAVPSGLGLVWYLPYVGVGAILVVRRPRTSIGWLLLALGWTLAFAVYQPDATTGQFADASLPLSTKALAFAVAASGSVGFLLYAVLATVFPSGRLPGGRWGRIARVLLALGVLCVALTAFAPTINVSLPGYANGVLVPNPFAILTELPIWQVLTADTLFPLLLLVLAISVLSLIARFRRSEGVERQQLRWIGAALAFVVVAVLAGLLIVTLIPDAGESGLAWLLAIVAFATVPIAIGIAVLRYRLYEIDTVINRTIVYGLLTAILAGASAAAVGLAQRLFTGVIGQGSDASIVLTTLVVVTAFNPIKSRLQSLVDRHFKEARSPTIVLAAFVAEVHGSISRPDMDRTLQRLLEVAVSAYRAPGGEVRVESDGAGSRSFQTGTVTAAPGLRAAASSGALRVEILLPGGDPTRESAALQPALAAVLGETTLGG